MSYFGESVLCVIVSVFSGGGPGSSSGGRRVESWAGESGESGATPSAESGGP